MSKGKKKKLVKVWALETFIRMIKAADYLKQRLTYKRKILFISLTVSAIVPFLPLPLEPAAKIALGIFIMALLLWMTEAIPLYVTSMLILFTESVFLTPVLQVIEPDFSHKIFLVPFFSDIIALFLGGLLLARAGSKYHIDVWVAKNVIRFAGKKPKYVLLAMMFTTAFLSMWMSNTATTAMMLIITIALMKSMNETSTVRKAFFLGIPFAANVGGMGTPVGTPPNAIAMAQINKLAADPITFAGWMVASVPLVLLLLFILWRLLLFVYPQKEDEEIIYEDDATLSKNLPTFTVIGIFFLTIILWLTTKVHGMSSGIVALIPAIVFLGFNILDVKDFKSISWDVLFLVAGGSSLAIALEKSGLANEALALIPFSDMNTLIILVMFMVMGSIMTSFMSNTATANIVVPLIFLVPGITGLPIAVATALAISSSMVLPVSTPPNALAYSSGQLELKDMFRMGATISFIALVIVIFIGYNWWKLLGYF